MKYLDMLPYNVVQCPEIFVVEVVPLGYRYTVRITDYLGKEWYIRSVGRVLTNDSTLRTRYTWTRGTLFTRTWTRETAQRHADRIGSLVVNLINEKEEA